MFQAFPLNSKLVSHDKSGLSHKKDKPLDELILIFLHYGELILE